VTADFGKLADPAGKAYDRALAGGGILDLGVYTTWFSHFALGTPTGVAASGSLTETGVDAQSSTVLDFASGAQSIMSVNLLAATSGRATISGSLARIELDPKFIYPSGFDLIAADGSLLRFDDDSGLRVHDGLAWQAAAVARHIADGMMESPWHPLDRSIAMMETIDEVRAQLGYAL
jgi:predicted dehydrogenase